MRNQDRGRETGERAEPSHLPAVWTAAGASLRIAVDAGCDGRSSFCVALPAIGYSLLARTDIGGERTPLVYGPPALSMAAISVWVATGTAAGRAPLFAGVWLFALVHSIANGLVLIPMGLGGFDFAIGVDPWLALGGLLPLLAVPAAVVSALHLRREIVALRRGRRRVLRVLVAASAACALALVPWSVHEFALRRGWSYLAALEHGDAAARDLAAERFRPWAWCFGLPAASIARELGPVPDPWPHQTSTSLHALYARLERGRPRLGVLAAVAPLIDDQLSR